MDGRRQKIALINLPTNPLSQFEWLRFGQVNFVTVALHHPWSNLAFPDSRALGGHIG